MFARPRRNPALEAYLGKSRVSRTFDYTRTRTYAQISRFYLSLLSLNRLGGCCVTVVVDDVT
jgi:hypothetical protein